MGRGVDGSVLGWAVGTLGLAALVAAGWVALVGCWLYRAVDAATTWGAGK